jgi:hypothetical protein
MREITKAMTSYTWAMSMFWTQQMVNLLGLGGAGSWNRSARGFTKVTEATTAEMGETMRAVFRSGDTLQRGLVDVFLAPLSFMNGNGSNGNGGNAAARDEPPAGGPVDASRVWTAGDSRNSSQAGTGPASQPPAPPSTDPSLGWGPMQR